MIAGKIWKSGNSYVVTIPREELEARGLHLGQIVGIDPVPLELRAVEPLTPEQRAAGWKTQQDVEREWAEHVERNVADGGFSREALIQADQDIDKGAEWTKHL